MAGFTLPRLAYTAILEAATPALALAAYRRSGAAAARQVLAISGDRRPSRSDYLLWVHGASVGETLSTLPLVRSLLKADTRASVLITATTPTALERLAMEDLGSRVVLQHRPADAVSAVRRFLCQWQPNALLLVESELWPNLMLETRDAGVPIGLVNARLSSRSLARWRSMAPETLRELLSCSSVTLAQTPRMAKELNDVLSTSGGFDGNLSSSAAAPEADTPVLYRGDLKQLPNRSESALASAFDSLHAVLGERSSDKGGVWLAASTHPGEEQIVLDAHTALRSGDHPNLLLLLVPRHPERGPQVAAAAREATATAGEGVVVSRSLGEAVRAETAVYVCDTLGELPALYSLAGVAFVGGSLVPLGGHSLLEAAQARGGCTVLHGPHIEAVEHAAAALAGTMPRAAHQIHSADELAAAVDALLSDDGLRDASRAAASTTARALEQGVLDGVWEELRGPLGLPELC